MKTREIRRKFLEYFKQQGHTVAPSSPVIPHDDPTLLFVNAGMNQFKKVFLGQTQLEYKRAATSQKCIRVGGKHNDLDNVGHTSRHLTFFEMLGNFSFGDYFKEDAIRFAWEATMNVFELDKSKIWVSVYEEDDEALELWTKWISRDRIVKMGAKDNFWAMGDAGPCGPCTELYFDRGEAFGSGTSPKDDPGGERYFEFWNLVFMQFNREEGGKMNPLPKPAVDTGMGLERMASLKIGAKNLFETDILRGIISTVETLSRVEYAKNPPAFHVIADHLRSLSFAIADGAEPSNVERGYVLRKLLRRAVRYGRQIGFEEPFLAKAFPSLLERMGEDYPELASSKDRIVEILTIEEENFFRTLRRGGNILQAIIEEAKKSQSKQITGNDAFKLKDTYGFPLEEILLLAKDNGLEVNLDAYMILEEKAKELSKHAREKQVQVAEESLFLKFLEDHKPTSFIGYDHLEGNGSIIGMIVNGKFQETLKEGEEGGLILDQTVFYAEMGGQVGDSGKIYHHSAHFQVKGTISPYPGIVLHQGVLKKGTFIKGEPVHMAVDPEFRKVIQANHTATHLLHWALEQVLGGHIRQAGSLVEPTRLRFDFAHHKPISDTEIRQIEEKVNDKIRLGTKVKIYQMNYEIARQRSDIKQFFGEKYGKEVRVVNIDDYSKELCGGTHVANLSEIGLFRITKESSIAAGQRRIEAVTGKKAEEFMFEREDQLLQIAAILEAQPGQALDKTRLLLQDRAHLQEQLRKMRKAHMKTLLDELILRKEKVGEISIICSKVELFKDEFAPLANDLLAKMGSGVLLLGMEEEDRCQLLLRVSPDLFSQGIKASDLIREIAPLVGGSGGGREGQAQAGGKDKKGIESAFLKAKELLKRPV